MPGSNPTDSFSWALRLTLYEASGDLCVKPDMHSDYHINDTLSSSFTYNPGQNIWSRIEKSSKTGQDKKSLISTFACFLTATTKV